MRVRRVREHVTKVLLTDSGSVSPFLPVVCITKDCVNPELPLTLEDTYNKEKIGPPHSGYLKCDGESKEA